MARDTNFYYSFLVLPADKRRAIIAVWDFCRAVDDAVDELPAGAAPSEARARVDWWRHEVARCFETGSPESRRIHRDRLTGECRYRRIDFASIEWL